MMIKFMISWQIKEMDSMETKMITIPFDVERAKKIQAGEEPGNITIRDGRRVRIVCWDMNDENYPIAGIITDYDGRESITTFTEAGRYRKSGEDNCDLCLLIPEWTQYKDGDIIYCDTTNCRGDRYAWLAVMKELRGQVPDGINIDFYFSLDIEGEYKGEIVFDRIRHYADYVRLATAEEKQQLIDALKQSSDSRAKEYLKRFFGIEKKKECKFEFLQPVLVRDGKGDSWKYGEFTFGREGLYYINGGISWVSCIPYNDQTKHLLGTTDDWEE